MRIGNMRQWKLLTKEAMRRPWWRWGQRAFGSTEIASPVYFVRILTEIHLLTYHTFNPFKIYNSMALTVFTQLCILELSDQWSQPSANRPTLCMYINMCGCAYMCACVCTLVCVSSWLCMVEGKDSQPPGHPDLSPQCC